MKVAIALRHIHFEDVGTLHSLLIEHGYNLEYLDPTTDSLTGPDLQEADLLIVLGGPIGAGDEMTYPFLSDELSVIQSRLRSGKPMLGICLGAQLIARALGAKVYPMGALRAGRLLAKRRLPINPRHRVMRARRAYLLAQRAARWRWKGPCAARQLHRLASRQRPKPNYDVAFHFNQTMNRIPKLSIVAIHISTLRETGVVQVAGQALRLLGEGHLVQTDDQAVLALT